MTVISMKSRTRVRTEPMPAHWLTPPEGAPGCYGNAARRGPDCWRAGCPFRHQCTDYIGRAREDERTQAVTALPRRHRLIVPDDAPMLPNLQEFRERAWVAWTPPRSVAEKRLMGWIEDHPDGGEVATIAAQAYFGGLVPIETALDVGEMGELFLMWLYRVDPEAPDGPEPSLLACVWASAEATRQALRGEGRPHVFDARHHHELWSALTIGPDLSCDALGELLVCAERWFRVFEEASQADFAARGSTAS